MHTNAYHDILVSCREDVTTSFVRTNAARHFDNKMLLAEAFEIDIRAIKPPPPAFAIRHKTLRRIAFIKEHFSYSQMAASKVAFMDLHSRAEWTKRGFDEVTKEEARARAVSTIQR